MLDRYVNTVMGRLSGIIAGVMARREELERQRGSDRYAQSYLGTTLKHPEGHTSPLRKSAERAQQEYAAVRAEWAEKGPDALGLLATLMIARERRDETKAVWERHDAEERRRVATKYHLEVRRLFAQLYDHGVRPAMLDLLRPETIGIIADIILWEASDRGGNDPNSPLTDLFGVYADRTMIMPGGGHTVTRSTRGVAPPTARYTDPDYYRFGGSVAVHHAEPGEDAVDNERDELGGDLMEIAPNVASSVDDQPADQGQIEAPEADAPTVHALTLDRAHAWAEAIYQADPTYLRIYWPREGVDMGDYDPERLIPALERLVASDRSWSGADNFLGAAREGRAREFIESRRLSGIQHLADQLIAGDERALAAARAIGFPA